MNSVHFLHSVEVNVREKAKTVRVVKLKKEKESARVVVVVVVKSWSAAGSALEVKELLNFPTSSTNKLYFRKR